MKFTYLPLYLFSFLAAFLPFLFLLQSKNVQNLLMRHCAHIFKVSDSSGVREAGIMQNANMSCLNGGLDREIQQRTIMTW